MADTQTLPPQQHSQPSRKGKKAWRKNVDVTQVQAGLEELTEEIIKGGIRSEKASAELFTTDTTGSALIKSTYNKTHKPLKADEILAQRSALPPVNVKKRSTSLNVTDGIIRLSTKRHKKNAVTPKELERLRKIAYGGDTTHKDVVQADIDADYDPWAMETVAAKPKYDFLEEKMPVREPNTLKRASISLAKSGKEIPALAKPSGGKSYNPTFEDWNTVLERELAISVELEEKRLIEKAKEDELQERIAKAREEEEQQRENESAWESEWESEWEGILSEREDNAVNGSGSMKKRPQRKTQAERNKINRRKEEARRKVHEAKERKREEQVLQTKALLRAYRQKEAARVEKVVDSDADDSSLDGEPDMRRRRLGKAVIPDAPLEVVLAEELQESLRLLKPEGNLLKDRFRSMMVRGKIETRAPIWQHKQAKVTATEKWSYKDWKLK